VRARALFVAGLLVGAVVAPAAPAAAAVDDIDTSRLRSAVTVNGILKHERVLQRIATQAGGTRASGTPGYNASALYVAAQLRGAGYKVSRQAFEFPYFEELAPARLSSADADYEASTLDYSGSGEATGQLVPADNLVIPATEAPSSAAGCVAGDYPAASADAPQIALAQRGTCTFGEKAAAAAAAGYEAVVIFNEGNPGRTELLEGTLGAPVELPVIGVDYATGVALAEALPVVTVATSTVSEQRTTYNVIADSPQGDPDKVVVVGAHLDSVPVGAGLNDNGSGTATILETAIQGAKLGVAPRQKVRFAFWGAEENGLLGAQYYVDNLSDRNLARIYANLNFDMLGSSNYVRFVYDGDGSAAGVVGPPGSGEIERIFTDYFAEQGLASAPTPFDGRSDYGPFIAAGIPAGGLFSGAEGIKTDEEAELFGGTAGEPYDPCYHLACDDITNLSTKALSELGDAAAHAVATLALTRSGLFEDGSRVALRTPADTASFAYRGHAIR